MTTLKPAMAPGSFAMLSDDAPNAVRIRIGSEAVLKIISVSGKVEGDVFTREYLCQHMHRGRLTFDYVEGGSLPESWLIPITNEAAQGQMMIYNAQAEEGGNALAALITMFGLWLFGCNHDSRPAWAIRMEDARG